MHTERKAMKILSFKVHPATVAAEYATEGKVYFRGDQWTANRDEALQFANVGTLLRAYQEFTLEKGEAMPPQLTENYAIEDAVHIEGTGNHVVLTDDEVRVLEFVTANLAFENVGPDASPVGALHRKLRAFGLSTQLKSFHLTLGDTSYHLEAESNE